MNTKRNFIKWRATTAIPAMVALAVGAGIGWQAHDIPARADENAAAVAEIEVGRFYKALSGDGALDEVLGDAFQLMRTDGRRYDRESYLAGASALTGFSIRDVEATRAGDVLTATFFADLGGTVGGVQRETVGQPRMAVFTEVDGAWKMQAFANLGQGAASNLDVEAKQAVDAWLAALASGDVGDVRNVLAPEFQIVRSDGSAYGAEEYMASGLPRIDAIFAVDDVVATGFGDHMVVRYALGVKESLEGGLIDGTAPRMTVFRRMGDTWLVVAHANFARPQS